MDIYYRLDSPTDLADLNDSFSRSQCKGYYLFLDNIQLSSNRNTFDRKSINYLHTINSLKKKIVLTYNFNKKLYRPYYHSPKLNSITIRRLEEYLKKKRISKTQFEDEKKYFN